MPNSGETNCCMFRFQEKPERATTCPSPQTQIFLICGNRRALISLRKCPREEIFTVAFEKPDLRTKIGFFYDFWRLFRSFFLPGYHHPQAEIEFLSTFKRSIFGPSNSRASRSSRRFPRHVLPPQNCQGSLAPSKIYWANVYRGATKCTGVTR